MDQLQIAKCDKLKEENKKLKKKVLGLERNAKVLASNTVLSHSKHNQVATKTIDFYETTGETKSSNIAVHYSSSKEFDT